MCIGCGLCVSLCDSVFELDENGKAFSKIEPVPQSSEGCTRDAADQCPVEAIHIEE
ncbi:MAG: ferredoxin [Aminobacterium colombiense]|nr:ferredoxin [Aminobacterium colombiense]